MFRSSHITSKCYLSIEAGECGFSWFSLSSTLRTVHITWRSGWSSRSLTPNPWTPPLSLLSRQTWKHIKLKITPRLHVIHEGVEKVDDYSAGK